MKIIKYTFHSLINRFFDSSISIFNTSENVLFRDVSSFGFVDTVLGFAQDLVLDFQSSIHNLSFYLSLHNIVIHFKFCVDFLGGFNVFNNCHCDFVRNFSHLEIAILCVLNLGITIYRYLQSTFNRISITSHKPCIAPQKPQYRRLIFVQIVDA